jgi:16S rRNA (adenine1518-N6/adenine1519-N6)-dimethyltransferase
VTHSPQAIRALLDGIGASPRRGLGQNFVADPNTVRRVARLANVGPGDHVVEIGAGLGSLTLALAETGADVTAVEVDHRIVVVLRTVLSDAGLSDAGLSDAGLSDAGLSDAGASGAGVTVIEADAMTLDWTRVLAGHDRWTLVANLPYNVATPLVCDLLDTVPAIERMLVMVQREVADRFVADPGSKQYGAVSVKVAYWASARLVGVVPASVFVPRPNVESALVEITRRRPPATDPSALFSLVRTAFGQRRKMLRRSLAERVTVEQFATAGISPEARPEQLDVAAWCRLTEAVAQ